MPPPSATTAVLRSAPTSSERLVELRHLAEALGAVAVGHDERARAQPGGAQRAQRGRAVAPADGRHRRPARGAPGAARATAAPRRARRPRRCARRSCGRRARPAPCASPASTAPPRDARTGSLEPHARDPRPASSTLAPVRLEHEVGGSVVGLALPRARRASARGGRRRRGPRAAAALRRRRRARAASPAARAARRSGRSPARRSRAPGCAIAPPPSATTAAAPGERLDRGALARAEGRPRPPRRRSPPRCAPRAPRPRRRRRRRSGRGAGRGPRPTADFPAPIIPTSQIVRRTMTAQKERGRGLPLPRSWRARRVRAAGFSPPRGCPSRPSWPPPGSPRSAASRRSAAPCGGRGSPCS